MWKDGKQIHGNGRHNPGNHENTMTQYLSKRTGRDTSVLRTRTYLLFWRDIAYGPTRTMIILAMQMEREHLNRSKERRHSERRISASLS